MKGENSFSQIFGHRQAIDLFRQQLAEDAISHAYLLVGEPRVGKTTVARALAQALLPQMALKRHPDYWEDDREDSLKLDEIRLLPDHQPEFHSQSLQAFLALKPTVGNYRVAVITNLARLAAQLQAVLLKTLEEPHPGRVIILTAPSLSPFVVLPTVLSRCQQVSLHPLSSSLIEEILAARGASSETSREVAELARGRPGWAVEALADQQLIENSRRWTARLTQVFGAPASNALRTAAELDLETRQRSDRSGTNLSLVLTGWQLELRRRMLGAGEVREAAKWATLLEDSYQIQGFLGQNVSSRLALETFLLKAGRIASY